MKTKDCTFKACKALQRAKAKAEENAERWNERFMACLQTDNYRVFANSHDNPSRQSIVGISYSLYDIWREEHSDYYVLGLGYQDTFADWLAVQDISIWNRDGYWYKNVTAKVIKKLRNNEARRDYWVDKANQLEDQIAALFDDD